MRRYGIKGMSCAACSARVEKAVSALSGVDNCSVNLLTNSMTVMGKASDIEIINAVEKAGYSVVTSSDSDSVLKDNETPILKRRLIASLGFLAVLMYISMGHTMWHLPLPHFLSGSPAIIAFIQFTLTVIVMVINKKFFISGFNGLKNKAPNMDTLELLKKERFDSILTKVSQDNLFCDVICPVLPETLPVVSGIFV